MQMTVTSPASRISFDQPFVYVEEIEKQRAASLRAVSLKDRRVSRAGVMSSACGCDNKIILIQRGQYVIELCGRAGLAAVARDN